MIDGILTLNGNLVSADVETTGRDPKKDRIWQIGIVKVTPDGTVSEGSEFVNPQCEIPRELIDNPKFKLTPETLKEIYAAPTFSALAPRLHKGLSSAEVLVGFNLAFDIRFFVEEFKREGLAFEPPSIIDGFRIYTHFHPRTLTAAVKEYLGEDLEGAHDGLNDARATLRVVVEQLRRHPELPRDIKELHRMFFGTVAPGNVDVAGKITWRHGKPVLAFGKWNGTPLQEAGNGDTGRYSFRSYLEWCIRDGDFPPDTKRVMQDALMGKFPLPPESA